MVNLKYEDKYIPKQLIENCFVNSNHNFVDKTFCGNGFTTGYISIKPTKKHQSNIIIVPNREVILTKRDKYLKDENINKNRIGFIFGDDNADKISFKDFDVLMFVIDSFVDRVDYLKQYSNCIDKILIDEMHSMYIQSTFRKKLKLIDEVLSDNFRDKAIVSVSATPMLFQSIDIKISKPINNFISINITENQYNSLERVKQRIKANKRVIIASHNAQLIASLSNNKRILKANFKIGISLKQSLVELCQVIQDSESNITIISSTGFEGFDVDNGVNDVFIFEDRAYDFSTFYFQNVLQIIGRSRKGTNYVEYCRSSHSEGRAYFDLEKMNKVVNSKRISFEKKMTDKNYYYIPKFYYPILDKKLEGSISNLVLDDITYNLYSETQRSDVNGVNYYKKYAIDRGFKLNYLNDGFSRKKFNSPKEITKIKYIKKNISYIKKNKVYDDININLLPKDYLKDYIRELRKYFRRKYYHNLEIFEISKGFDIDDFLHYSITENELISYESLLSGFIDNKEENKIYQLVSYFSSEYKKKKLTEYKGNYKNVNYKKEIKEFQAKIFDIVIRLVLTFAHDQVKVPSKKRVWRDYNLFTETSIFMIEYFAEEFEKCFKEYDIKTCNSRVIYAYCGLRLPNDFYGENKKNKKAINILLNTLSKDYAITKGIDLKKRKETIKRSLYKYGFDEKVISFLLNFWDKPKDSLFNWCAYHEEKIINSLKSQLIDCFGGGLFSFIRRHDSIILLGNDISEEHENNIYNILSNFEYLNQKGWFLDEVYINQKNLQLNKEIMLIN